MADAIVLSTVEKGTASERARWCAWIELAIAYVLIMTVTWSARPLQRVLWLLAVTGIVIIFARSWEGWRALGLRIANFWRSVWIVAAAIAAAGTAILVAGQMDTLNLPAGGVTGFIRTYIGYAIWAGVQQLLLQGLFMQRLVRAIPYERHAALIAAVLFAVAHMPSFVLVPITLIWGLVACLHFLRYRNLFPLMIAHAILGIAVAVTIPGPVDHNMRVGLGYVTYSPHHHAQRFIR